jgi:hypothetical protein
MSGRQFYFSFGALKIEIHLEARSFIFIMDEESFLFFFTRIVGNNTSIRIYETSYAPS